MKSTKGGARLVLLVFAIFLNLNCNTNFLYGFTGVAFAADQLEPIEISEIRSRRLSETNGIADFLCTLVNLMRSDIAKALIALSLFAMGVGAFFGKLTIGWFFSFGLGCGVFFGSISLLGFFAPYSDVGMSCECRELIVLAQKQDGSGYIKASTLLDKKCNKLDDPDVTMGQF